MKKAITIFFTLILALSGFAKEKPQVKEVDGTFIVGNRDSKGKPFVAGEVFVTSKVSYDKYQYQWNHIDLLLFGLTADGGRRAIANISVSTENGGSPQKLDISERLADFSNIAITTLNGTITKSDIKAKDGNLYITVRNFDFQNIPSLVKQSKKELEEQKRKDEQNEKARLDEFRKNTFERGKMLYEQKILPAQEEGVPILISSYEIEMDAANGIDVSISFQNVFDKTIKYVDFEITPYNRVDDIARSTIGGRSRTTVQSVDYIQPNQMKKAFWRAVWYNPSISYIKINSVKVTFKDNSETVVPEQKIEKVFGRKEIRLDIENDTAITYIADDNDLVLSCGGETGLLSYNPIEYSFETESFQVNGTTKNSISSKTWFQKSGATEKPYNYVINDVLLAGVKSGEIRYKELGKTHGFSETELQFLRDCACIRYYVENKDRDFQSETKRQEAIEKAKGQLLNKLKK